MDWRGIRGKTGLDEMGGGIDGCWENDGDGVCGVGVVDGKRRRMWWRKRKVMIKRRVGRDEGWLGVETGNGRRSL